MPYNFSRPPRATAVDSLIKEMSEQTGTTTVVVSHDLITAFGLADHIHFIHEGRVVESGSPEEFKRSGNEHVRRFLERYAQGAV